MYLFVCDLLFSFSVIHIVVNFLLKYSSFYDSITFYAFSCPVWSLFIYNYVFDGMVTIGKTPLRVNIPQSLHLEYKVIQPAFWPWSPRCLLVLVFMWSVIFIYVCFIYFIVSSLWAEIPLFHFCFSSAKGGAWLIIGIAVHDRKPTQTRFFF